MTVYPTYQDTVYDTICANQAYTWNKHTLSPYHKKQLSQVTYTDTFSSVHGCDSITTLQLTVIPSYNDTVHYDIGIGDTFSLWGISYTNPGFYITSYRSSGGCDSTITHWVHKKIVSEEADIIDTSAVRVEPTVLNACQWLHIRVPEISQMRVYDMSGRLVHFSTLSEGENGYAVPCVCGIYNVVIESDLPHSSPKRSIVRILVL